MTYSHFFRSSPPRHAPLPPFFLMLHLFFVANQNAKQKTETADMVRAFREKKMRKAGTWTTEDEDEKRRLAEEKDMFSDYD
jgi:hypothetical protein